MSIFVGRQTRVLVQGITGRQGRFHTRRCLEYGTRIVAGVTPGKGGMRVEGVPVFDTVAEARAATGADTSLVFVPPSSVADALLEAAEAGVATVVCITEGVPVHDMLRVRRLLASRPVRLIGPNCPGVITPGECKVGIMPAGIHRAGGPVGVVSRSGTLTYEVVAQLSAAGLGQTTCVGIGGDPVAGTGFVDCLQAFAADPATGAVVLIGEIGGHAEEEAAAFIEAEMAGMPVAAFIAGRSAPPGRRMGHAGAIIDGRSGTAGEKIDRLRAAGVHVCEDLASFGRFCARVFSR